MELTCILLTTEFLLGGVTSSIAKDIQITSLICLHADILKHDHEHELTGIIATQIKAVPYDTMLTLHGPYKTQVVTGRIIL